MDSQPHRMLTVRPAHHYDLVGIALLDRMGERQRSDVLLKSRGEANDRVTLPIDTAQAIIEKRRDEAAQVQNLVYGLIRSIEFLLDMPQIAVAIKQQVAEELVSEKPLAGKDRVIDEPAELLVEQRPDSLGQYVIEVANITRNAASTQR